MPKSPDPIRVVENLAVFRDPISRPFALVPCPADVRATRAVRLDSPDFSTWLNGEYAAEHNVAPSPHALHAARAYLEGLVFRQPESRFTVARRVGTRIPADLIPSGLVLDLASPAGDAVDITPRGWSLAASPIPFEASRAARPLPRPVESDAGPLAPLAVLRSCLHLASDDDWLRVLAWLLAAFRPDGPYPVLILQGPSGSGKSMAARLPRTMVDPAVAPLAPTPVTVRDLAALALDHWVVALDHVARFTPNRPSGQSHHR